MKSFLPKAISVLFLAISLLACQTSIPQENNTSIARSEMLLDSIFKYYQAEGNNLFNENYPKSSNDKVTYLASTDTVTKDKVAYLWPTSGLFSGVNALLKTTRDNKYQALLQEKIIPGLECYYDTTRTPACFQSYISEAGHSDRFYDDNIWLGIDFLETYRLTGNKKYLKQSEEIWKFLLSGNDDVLNGGIYWCEQKKESKNTCSNAPASVLALQLFETTRDSAYYQKGLELYTWTKVNLQDSDYIYFDNLKTDGRTGTEKYAYNTGQMLQAASLLYKLTGNRQFLTEAQNVARAGINYFTEPFKTQDGTDIRLFRNRGTWFVAIMMRGYIELYLQDNNPEYLQIFADNLELAWKSARYDNGLINRDWSGGKKEKQQWLLNQAAMVEMYANLGNMNLK